MIGTDDLFRLQRRLDNSDAHAGAVRDAAAAELRDVLLHQVIPSPTYQIWMAQGEQAGQHCPAPSETIGPLRSLGLLDEAGTLRVKIHEHCGKIFLTDGLWVPNDIRVFPFTDESQRLMEFAMQHGLERWADWTIDPACGCGHHAIAFPQPADRPLTRVSLDINPRALAYAAINRILNRTAGLLLGLNDLTCGLPDAIHAATGNVLFLVNMPFALTPQKGVLPLTADGGPTGASRTFAALAALAQFRDQNRQRAAGRACVLCYSVGNRQADRWEVVERARSLFSAEKVRWNVLTNELMWRVNGRKEQPNPMPLSAVPTKAECPFYVTDENREAARRGYANLVETLTSSADHWDVLGYGVLDIDLGAGRWSN